MFSRIVAVMLAVSFVVLQPTEGDMANRKKSRFKIIERTHDSEPFISLAGIARATRYPDTIEINGPRDSHIKDIDLHLYDFRHDMPQDIDVLLVAPNGRTALVMSDAGGSAITQAINLTLDDEAKRQLPRDGSISGGRYKPANYDDEVALSGRTLGVQSEPGSEGTPGGDGEPGEEGTPGEGGTPGEPGDPGTNPDFVNDDFPDPAPDFGDAIRLSTFRGMDPTGTWQLFIRSDGPSAGVVEGGWGLTIEVKKRR